MNLWYKDALVSESVRRIAPNRAERCPNNHTSMPVPPSRRALWHELDDLSVRMRLLVE